MTTEQLRKEIMVTNWNMSSKGLTIDYWKGNVKKSLLYNPIESVRELNSIGSIDSCSYDGTNLVYHGAQMQWIDFLASFTFSQWDALSLIIRHEYEREVRKQLDNSDLGKAIDKLK